MTPMLEIHHGAEPLVLYGYGAKFTAETDGIVTIKPVGDTAVTVRVPRRATSLPLNGGETLSITVAAGDVIEIA